jgi:hypothetical protein
MDARFPMFFGPRGDLLDVSGDTFAYAHFAALRASATAFAPAAPPTAA